MITRSHRGAGSICVAVLGSLLFTGCGRVEESGVGSAPVEVSVVSVTPTDIPVTLQQVGQTLASESVEIRSRVQGFLLSRGFDEGKRVEAGQVLFELDAQPFRVELDIAEARLQQVLARVERADREVRRFTQLLEDNAGSRKELEDAQTELLQAQADARASLAAVAKAKLDLSYTTITSPFRGTISESYKSVGALVDAGSNSLLAKVTQLDPIGATMSISEQEGLAFQRDLVRGKITAPSAGKATVSVALVDGSTYGHTGEVDFIAPEIDPTTGLARLRAKLPNPDGKLTAGQFVRLTIGGFTRRDAILVPQRSVIQSPAGQSVYVVSGEGQVTARPVRMGAWVGDHWVVEEGLASGESVVVDGAQRVRAGMRVKAVPAGALTQSGF